MDWYRAQDTFTADLEDHTQVRVVKGEPLPGSHELVIRDLDAARAAAKAGTDRVSLFRKLDTGEEEAPKSAAKAEAEPKAAPVKTAPKAAAPGKAS